MDFGEMFKDLLSNSNYGNGGGMSFGNNNAYSNQDLSNMNRLKADGGDSGSGGLGVNPLKMALGVANSGVNIAQAVMQPKFNFGQDNYTAEQAGQAEGGRASNIGKAVGSAIPGVGGVLGGIFGLIAQKVAQRKGEQKANMILGSRESHMKNLEDYQMKKVQDNNFLKSSDMYKDMFNQNKFEI